MYSILKLLIECFTIAFFSIYCVFTFEHISIWTLFLLEIVYIFRFHQIHSLKVLNERFFPVYFSLKIKNKSTPWLYRSLMLKGRSCWGHRWWSVTSLEYSQSLFFFSKLKTISIAGITIFPSLLYNRFSFYAGTKVLDS